MKNKKIIVSFCLFLLMPLFVYPLRIDNPKMRVKLDEGKTAGGTVTVENPTTESVNVKVYLEDFDYVAPYDGDKQFSSRGTSKRSISDMLTFSPEQFVLEPYSSRQVNFSISPKRKFDETLCGVLFFETSIGSSMEEGKAIDVLGRLGSLIFVDPVNSKKDMVIGDVLVTGSSLTAMVENKGNMFFDAAGTYYVMDSEGMVYDRGRTNELFLMPADKAALKCDLSKKLSSGSYTVVLTFDLQDGDVVTKEVEFSVSASGDTRALEVKD